MKNLSILALILFYNGYIFAQISSGIKPLPNKAVETQKAIYLNTIDPAVMDISFKTVKRSTGDILRVTGTIKNKGGKHYTSGANQQNIQMWESYSSVNRKMVKQLRFNQLNSNSELQIIYERPAFKNSKEFPPDYMVFIEYDPDIRADNNTNNDDAVLSNNSMTKNPKSN